MGVLQQIPSIILPRVWVTGTEIETVADAVTHVSLEFNISYLRDKIVHISAIEIVAAGVPGPLWAWIELSPFPTTISAAYWAAIGGGGGIYPPVAPLIEVGTGVNLATHGLILPWQIHSPYARLVVQTPVAVATARWAIQCIVSAKG